MERAVLLVMSLEENVLDHRQESYLDWLTSAPQVRTPSTKKDLAVVLGVNITTLRRWEKQEVFRKRWHAQVDEVVGSPERTQRLLDVMEAAGLGGDVASAKLFFQVTGKLQPASLTVQTGGSAASDLSNEQLDALIGQMAERERASRSLAS